MVEALGYLYFAVLYTLPSKYHNSDGFPQTETVQVALVNFVNFETFSECQLFILSIDNVS